MKRFLNTLFVLTQGAYLSKEGECVAVNLEGKLLTRLPLHTLSAIVLFGQVSISPFLLSHCAEKGVSVSWLTENGRFLGVFNGPLSGNVLLRRAQYRASDDPDKSRDLARAFCVGKIYNCRTVLRRAAREKEDADLDAACERLGGCLARLKQDVSLDEVRGIEGEAAQVYFSVFGKMVLAPGFAFRGRNRRPPLDEVNCLLSFLYTLLTHDLRSALESVGLDPQVGFLHRDRPGRPSLALDLIEEFRPWQADRLALTLINKKQLSPKDFQRTESGAVLLRDEARKTVLTAWQERKREEIVHPFLNEKMYVGLVPQVAARLLASHLRGDLDMYPPYVLR